MLILGFSCGSRGISAGCPDWGATRSDTATLCPHPARQYNEYMSAGQRVKEHRDEILRVASLHGAGNVRLFGSVARGEDTPESDVDLLVDVTDDTTPWFPGSLIADLEQLLGQRVQVVIRRSLSPLIRDAVLRKAVQL